MKSPPESKNRQVAAEVAVYSLSGSTGDLVCCFLQRLEQNPVDVSPGPLSTNVVGPAGAVFGAISEAFLSLDLSEPLLFRCVVTNASPLISPQNHATPPQNR